MKLVSVFLILAALIGCQTLSDRSDKQALIKQTQVPSYAELITYEGFPWMSGFGQREGLNIRAVFKIPEERLSEFQQYVRDNNWQPLPMPETIKDSLPGNRKELIDAVSPEEGYYRCHSAGNNVLHANVTYDCSKAKLNEYRRVALDETGKVKRSSNGEIEYEVAFSSELTDVILSVYDAKNNALTAIVLSSY